MKSTKVAGDAGFETRVVILDSGEEAFATLTKFANDAKLTAASLTAIGAFEKATIGWLDFENKTYKKIEVTRGGHLLAGTVRPTLEVVLIDTPSHLRRKKHPDIGIALIDLEAGKR
jgi:uncharacterized protein